MLLLAGLATMVPAQAYFITGQMLKDALEASDRLKNGNPQAQDEREAQFGRGFVAGVADSALDGLRYCSPGDATLGQFNDVALRYLRAHPDDSDVSGAAVVVAGLLGAYPCPRQ